MPSAIMAHSHMTTLVNTFGSHRLLGMLVPFDTCLVSFCHLFLELLQKRPRRNLTEVGFCRVWRTEQRQGQWETGF